MTFDLQLHSCSEITILVKQIAKCATNSHLLDASEAEINTAGIDACLLCSRRPLNKSMSHKAEVIFSFSQI